MALSFIRARVSPRRNSLLRFFANVSTMKVIYVGSYSPSFLVVEEARLTLENEKARYFRRVSEDCSFCDECIRYNLSFVCARSKYFEHECEFFFCPLPRTTMSTIIERY